MLYKIGQCNYDLLGSAAVVLLTGNAETAVFCREVADLIRQRQLGEIWVCLSLAEFEGRSRYPAFLGRWWYSGSADRLTAEDKKAFKRLLKKPVESGTAVLTGMDFAKYKELTRNIRNHTHIHEVSASFPTRRFLVDYVKRGVILRGSLISQGASEAFIWRLGDEYSRYEYYLDRLVAELPRGATEVTPKHVQATLKGVTGASFDDFLKYLMRPLSNGNLARTNKLFKSYRCMIDDGATKTLRRLHNKSLQYLEIRRLINEGYIPANVESTVEGLHKLLGDQPGTEFEGDGSKATVKAKRFGKFTCWDILAWGDGKFRREVQIAASAPLADWFTVALLSSKTCSTDEEAERVFFDILTRSRQATNNIL